MRTNELFYAQTLTVVKSALVVNYCDEGFMVVGKQNI